MAFNNLTDEEKRVIEGKATERPFSGEYDNFYKEGTYVCRKCNSPLFSSKAKFDAGCGWPAFEEFFSDSVREVLENDGRTEISCARCGGHLGHVFRGEMMTEKNTRHCVNSLSIKFIGAGKKLPETFEA